MYCNVSFFSFVCFLMNPGNENGVDALPPKVCIWRGRDNGVETLFVADVGNCDLDRCRSLHLAEWTVVLLVLLRIVRFCPLCVNLV